MSKTAKKTAVLPKHAPKKTGKRGPRPLDPEKDSGRDQLLTDAAEQSRLPGMEDTAIEEIEDNARTYKAIQNQRIALLKQEVDLKDLLLTIMKRHGKQTYHRDGLDIRIVHTEEKVKVKISDEDKADEETLANA